MIKKIIISILLTFLVGTSVVDAASFTVNSSVKSIMPNSTFTVSVGGDAIGRVNLSVTNGSLSTASVWVEQNYQTVTVTAGASGVVTVTATPVTGFSDPDANIYNPGSRTITVTINSNTTTTKPPVTTVPSNKSKDNDLLAIELDQGKLTPAFDKNITEYTVNLSKEVDTLNVSTKLSDSKAKISGAGKIELKPGLNKIKLTVTAENGSKKVYTISAYLDETPTIYLDYKEQKIGLVRNLSNVTLENFEAKELTIDGEKTTAFEKGNLTLIYGLTEDGQKNFYLYEKEKDSIKNIVVPVKLGDKMYYFIDKNADAETLIIEKIEVYATKTGIDDYYLLSAIDEEGTEREYIYETEEKTLGLYSKDLYQNQTCTKDENTKSKLIIKIESAILLFSILLSIYFYKKSLKVGK